MRRQPTQGHARGVAVLDRPGRRQRFDSTRLARRQVRRQRTQGIRTARAVHRSPGPPLALRPVPRPAEPAGRCGASEPRARARAVCSVDRPGRLSASASTSARSAAGRCDASAPRASARAEGSSIARAAVSASDSTSALSSAGKCDASCPGHPHGQSCPQSPGLPSALRPVPRPSAAGRCGASSPRACARAELSSIARATVSASASTSARSSAGRCGASAPRARARAKLSSIARAAVSASVAPRLGRCGASSPRARARAALFSIDRAAVSALRTAAPLAGAAPAAQGTRTGSAVLNRPGRRQRFGSTSAQLRWQMRRQPTQGMRAARAVRQSPGPPSALRTAPRQLRWQMRRQRTQGTRTARAVLNRPGCRQRFGQHLGQLRWQVRRQLAQGIARGELSSIARAAVSASTAPLAAPLAGAAPAHPGHRARLELSSIARAAVSASGNSAAGRCGASSPRALRTAELSLDRPGRRQRFGQHLGQLRWQVRRQRTQGIRTDRAILDRPGCRQRFG